MAALPAADQRQDRTFPPHLRDRWVDARLYAFTEQRNDGLPDWMHFYNNDRVHSAIGGRPRVAILTNFPGYQTGRPG
ncbi:hypothetical protein MARA_29600 [Mycolicibacterium arabiense]|uniref:Integrase catalytic domain-containing protein n=1 Tax=Mycolicibacterium arabiense TaxID=1286181 RepID=A0A7I7RXY9_9MYCO|nr:hypothetical protein MARA_29600 [Mycolicibacterium arabiense]